VTKREDKVLLEVLTATTSTRKAKNHLQSWARLRIAEATPGKAKVGDASSIS